MAFARFRQVRARLNVSVVEAVRDGTKVRQRHVASLGSVPLAHSATDRAKFWVKLHQRLAALSNRLDDKARYQIMGAVHARIPMPTVEDQEAPKAAGREANAGFFGALRKMHRDEAKLYKDASEKMAEAAGAVDAVENANANRVMTHDDYRKFLQEAGFSNVELRQMRDLAKLVELVGDERVITVLAKWKVEAADRWVRRRTRTMLRGLRA
jgi:hypothetical protein